MRNHYTAAIEFSGIVCSEFSGLISKVVLYGSVAREQERPESDIDIAIILPNDLSCLPLDLEGYPVGFIDRVNRMAQNVAERIHLVFYWEKEYNKGIELYSGRRSPPDRLDAVGQILYLEDGF